MSCTTTMVPGMVTPAALASAVSWATVSRSVSLWPAVLNLLPIAASVCANLIAAGVIAVMARGGGGEVGRA